MADHEFHKAIGSLIDFPKSKSPRILKDKACADDGHLILLYNTAADTKAKIGLCNVDMLIEVEGKAKVIIEIEESDVKPVHIFGKFFASLFSNCYKNMDDRRNKSRRLPDSLLFIQIVEWPEQKEGSEKPEQWKSIEKQIQDSTKYGYIDFGLWPAISSFRDGRHRF
jgi:hypothetical protein